MATIDIRDLSGAKVGTLDLADEVFGAVNEDLLWEAVKHYRAAQHRGTHATKNRWRVSGSGKKLWKQKGTGRARVGEIRNPLWRKGGIVMGPQPRDYSAPLPKKMFRAALKSALAVKLRDKQLSVFDAFSLADHKTKAFSQLLTKLGFDRKILIIDHEENPNLRLAARNLGEVQLMPNLQLTPYHLLNARHVVFTKAAIQALQEVLSK
jgi:large subunit ribosomal protein L4